MPVVGARSQSRNENQGIDSDVRARAKSAAQQAIKVAKQPSANGQADHTDNNEKEENNIPCLPCTNWRTLIDSWEAALHWTEGLDKALSVMLACVTSTKALGSQLWAKVIGPPACGKSTLCEALSVNKQFVYAKSTLRGFHSGYDDGDGENHSPLQAMMDKTLVIKDGDTLLQSPNLSQILSEARDIYDRTSRSSYRTKASKDWEGLNITLILCGTSSLRQLDSSELGERFLDCVIMDGIDDVLENEILWRVVNQENENVSLEADGKVETQYNPQLLQAMQLTGGYVGYLRQNAQRLLGAVTISEATKKRCVTLGKFTAYMRAQANEKNERKNEVGERELASRLVSQLVRLAKCLAVVLNRTDVDGEAMRRVTAVAMDTSRGRTLGVTKHLFPLGLMGGSNIRQLAGIANQSEDRERAFLKFLEQIGVVKRFSVKTENQYSNSSEWRLTAKMRALYREVVNA